MLDWFYRLVGRRGGSNPLLGAQDTLFHPDPVHGREHVQRDSSQVQQMPSRGDKLLNEGLVIERPEREDDAE